MESKKRHRISYGVWDRKRVLIFHISTLYPASIKIFDFTSCSLPLKTLILLDYLMFSYAESAKAALLGAKGMLCYGSGISLLSKSVLSSIEVRESPNFLMRERSWSSCCVSRTAKRSSALNSPTT